MLSSAMFNNYLSSKSGATAIEYSLIAAGIGLTIVLGFFALGYDLAEMYDGLSVITDP